MGDENDMYGFLVKNKYIQTDIANNIYDSPVKLTSSIQHTLYKNRPFINFIRELFPDDFPFLYLKDLNKEKLNLDIKKIVEQSQSTNLNLKEKEIKKLVFIFCIVFFPLARLMNKKTTRLQLKYYPYKIKAPFLNRDTNYIELYNQFILIRGKKYEFIDVYIDWVKCDKLKNFACYTYLHFLLNMVEADIEFYENHIKDNKYYKKNQNIETELNGIKKEITSIIDSNKNKTFYTDGLTYSALYKQTDEEFIKFFGEINLYKYGYKKVIKDINGGNKSRKRKHKKQKRKSTRKKRRKPKKHR